MTVGLSRLDKPFGRIIPPGCQYWWRVLTGSVGVFELDKDAIRGRHGMEGFDAADLHTQLTAKGSEIPGTTAPEEETRRHIGGHAGVEEAGRPSAPPTF
jgi:hypothetical protein